MVQSKSKAELISHNTQKDFVKFNIGKEKGNNKYAEKYLVQTGSFEGVNGYFNEEGNSRTEQRHQSRGGLL